MTILEKLESVKQMIKRTRGGGVNAQWIQEAIYYIQELESTTEKEAHETHDLARENEDGGVESMLESVEGYLNPEIDSEVGNWDDQLKEGDE